jgi:hypothetical protein
MNILLEIIVFIITGAIALYITGWIVYIVFISLPYLLGIIILGLIIGLLANLLEKYKK